MEKLIISSPLVSIEWLNEHLNHPDLVILDATIPKVKVPDMPKAFQKKDIPGARFFDLKKTFRDLESPLSNTMPSPEKFAQEAGALGMSNKSVVVVYDHWGIYSSARAWWLFKTMGHQNVAVLNGGFPSWEKTELPTEPTKPYEGPSTVFNVTLQSELMVGAEAVLAAINNKGKTILDARSEGRFYGNTPEPRAELRSGHIPGSISMHYAKLIRDGKLISTQELETMFRDIGNSHGLVLSCGSGITACILALGASMIKLENMSVYDGSWAEWGGRKELPVEL